jgi:hypothetical protein
VSFDVLGKAEFSVHLEQQILHYTGVHHLTSYCRPNKVHMTKIITYVGTYLLINYFPLCAQTQVVAALTKPVG